MDYIKLFNILDKNKIKIRLSLEKYKKYKNRFQDYTKKLTT